MADRTILMRKRLREGLEKEGVMTLNVLLFYCINLHRFQNELVSYYRTDWYVLLLWIKSATGN